MPSAGRPKVSTRLDPEVIDAVRAQIEMTLRHANLYTVLDGEIATFVERAVIEKLAKMRRSREWGKKSRGRCQAPPAVQGIEETDKCTGGADVVQGESVRAAVASPDF